MNELIYDTSAPFREFMTSKGAPYSDARCRITNLPFESSHNSFLLPEDRDITENRSFTCLMVDPIHSSGEGFDEVLILIHGLNEGNSAKLFPWAYNLAVRLNVPVLIFPLAFHVHRRSAAWGFSSQVKLSGQRAAVPGNGKTSPFNALISHRLSEEPERFTRAGLQSYYDLIDLCDSISSGRHPRCRQGTVPHFLGYSAGGYLVLNLMLSNPGNRFPNSRCVLFASCAPLVDMHSASIFIVDQEAGDRLTGFLGDRGYEKTVYDTEVGDRSEGPAYWMSEILFGGPALQVRLQTISHRCLAIGGTNDRVIPLVGMSRNLSTLAIRRLDLGIHEFPFTIKGPLIEAYDRSQPETRDVIFSARGSLRIPEPYREVFGTFIREVTESVCNR
ncbi:MAG: DUF6051 family protein [Gemmatimonadota bacterium]|nr:DUF6051 family protein [Gemmatimonadota bacterium]